VSIGVQEVTLHIGKTALFKILLSITALVVVMQLWVKQLSWPWRIERSIKVLVVFTLLRFSVPLLVMMNEAVYHYVLEPEYTNAYTEVAASSVQVSALIEQVEVKQESLKEESSFLDSFNLSEKYRRFKVSLQASVQEVIDTFNESMDSIVKLITVFIINSVIIPLVALWLFVYGVGAFLRGEFDLELE
jgi:ribosome-binding ATPase YchF (GTP1/OBG family)